METPTPLPNNLAPTMPIQPQGVSTSSSGNPVLDEISQAHANLSPQAQKAIEGAHGMLGISPAHSDPALVESAAPSQSPFRSLGMIAPELAVPGVSGPRGPLPNLSPEVPKYILPSDWPYPFDTPGSPRFSGNGVPSDWPYPFDTPNSPRFRAPDAASPSADTPAGPASLPGAPASPPMPISPPMTAAQRELQRRETTGSGVHQFAQNHRWLGVPLEIADAIGSGFFPRFAQFIPGTSAKHNLQDIPEAEREVADEAAQAKNAADVAHAGAETGLEKSQADEAEARAETLRNPVAKEVNPENDAYKYYTSPAGGSLSPADAYAKILSIQTQSKEKPEKEDTPEVQAYKSLLKQGKSPEDAYAQIKQAGQTEKPDTSAQDDQKYEAIISKQLRGEKLTPEETADKGAYEKRKTLGQATTNVYANQREQNKEANATVGPIKKQLDAEFSRARTQLENIQEARTEIGSNPVGQSLGAVKTLVSLAGGQGSGVRITQPELNSIANGLGIKETFSNWLNRVSGQGRFDAATQKQINDVLSAVESTVKQKESLLMDTMDKLDGAKTASEANKIASEYRHAVAGGGATPSTAVQGNVSMPKPQTQADYDAIPKGAVYIDTDGQQKKKK